MITSSPRSSTASRLAIMVSVAPQQTVTSRSGSTCMPYSRAYLAAIAARSSGSPQVMAYWLTSAMIAAQAASLSSCGAAKSGNPWARLMPRSPWRRRISRVISRITDSVNRVDRLDTGGRIRRLWTVRRAGRRRGSAGGGRGQRFAGSTVAGCTGKRLGHTADLHPLRRWEAHPPGGHLGGDAGDDPLAEVPHLGGGWLA